MVVLQYSCKNLHVPRTRVWQLRTAGGRGAVSTGMELWNRGGPTILGGVVFNCGETTVNILILIGNKYFFTAYGKDLLGQRVVTFMSRVEVFATRIKIESSDQSLFCGLIKESRWPPSG